MRNMTKSKWSVFSKSVDLTLPASLPTPTAGTPKAGSPPMSPQLAPQGPSQLLTALLVRLPDCTNRALIDQAAVDFAFLNSKAARKRLIRVGGYSISINEVVSLGPDSS